MKLSSIEMRPLTIPFREAFQHAGATRAETESVLVRVSAEGLAGYGEGCPRSYVTGESVPTALAFFEHHKPALLSVATLNDVSDFVTQQRAHIDANPAAWCAIELALLDLLGKIRRLSLEGLLGLAPIHSPLHYSAVIGGGSPAGFAKQLAQYQAQGFTQYKIKLSGDALRDSACTSLLRQAGISPTSVRADANRLWKSAGEAIAYIKALNYPFWALEDPLVAFDQAALAEIAASCECKMILDEYLLRSEQLHAIHGDAWVINLRVSKMGGILRSLEMIEQARLANIPIIVGAQVGETSILTRAAITAAHACGSLLLAQEGAFGTILLEHDICSPALMFGRGGVLVANASTSQYGLGLQIAEPIH